LTTIQSSDHGDEDYRTVVNFIQTDVPVRT
jgi:hypothetical protein